ncbi:hypothetical protein V6N12_074686 [Hibiscus sabdariffa]|uniref:Uncharacterized protein n=1 Tax=Hibiscus sabdariffa TaxID=183260 RepID=A0ABR2BY02_9ROSI
MQLLHGIDWSGPHKTTSRWPASVDDDSAPACLETYQHITWAPQTRPSAGGVVLGPIGPILPARCFVGPRELGCIGDKPDLGASLLHAGLVLKMEMGRGSVVVGGRKWLMVW